jgi:hypothetical protein
VSEIVSEIATDLALFEKPSAKPSDTRGFCPARASEWLTRRKSYIS